MSIMNTVLVLYVLGQFGAKADYRIYIEDMVMEVLDPTYFDIENTEFYVVERSTAENTITSNISIIHTIPDDSDVHSQLMGWSMGKYNLPTGVDLSMKLCDVTVEPILLSRFFSIMGFTTDTCPPPPGIYFQESYSPSVDTLPDTFPENKYRAFMEITYKGKTILRASVYFEVQ